MMLVTINPTISSTRVNAFAFRPMCVDVLSYRLTRLLSVAISLLRQATVTVTSTKLAGG